MIILELIYFLFLSLSVSIMWNFSEIFKPIRNIVSRIPYLRRPFLCPECSSFWFGFFVSFLYNPIKLDFSFFIVTNLFCGLCSHSIAFFIFRKNVENKINFIK